MQHEYVQINKKKIVGFESQDADKMPIFILYMWAKLCPRFEEIKNVVDRSILYGVWYKPDGSYPGDDSPWCCIVGLEVNSTLWETCENNSCRRLRSDSKRSAGYHGLDKAESVKRGTINHV